MNRAIAKALVVGLPAAALGTAAVLVLCGGSEATVRSPRPLARAESRPASRLVTPITHAPRPQAPKASVAPRGAEPAPAAGTVPTPRSAKVALAALAKSVASPELSGYDEAVDALREALAVASPDDFEALRALFKTTTDATLLEALAEALDPSGLERPEVRAFLAEVANRDDCLDRRVAAIRALGLATPDDALLDQLGRLARADAEVDVRTAAANALGTSIEHDPARGPAIVKQLLEVAKNDADEGVRSAALWSVPARTADRDGVASLVQILTSDREVGPRQAAAEALADVGPEQRATVLATLSGAIEREADLDVRESLLTAIVRSGREDSVPILEAVKANHPELAPDAEDYLVELRKGEVDMEVLLEAKARREEARAPLQGDDAGE